MTTNRSVYSLVSERQYCCTPNDVLSADVLIVGSGIGLASADYLRCRSLSGLGRVPRIVVAEAGPFELLGHVGDHAGYKRRPYIQNPGRMGGDLTQWGVSTPRPRPEKLGKYPYSSEELMRRFSSVEAEMGVHEPIPMSGGDLELSLLSQLRHEFSEGLVSVAPLAINRFGRRWCPLKYVPELVKDGVKLLARFRCTKLIRNGSRIDAVNGTWGDGSKWVLKPKIVVLAVGAEHSIPLVQQVAVHQRPLRCSDHHRIDCHGWLPAGSLGRATTDQLGVAVIIVELSDLGCGIDTPFHLECKIAPWRLWKEGYMQSSDNLAGNHHDDTIYVQIQAVAATKHPLPTSDLLNLGTTLSPVMSKSDALFQGRIIEAMVRVCDVIGLKEPHFCPRALLTNHHLYRAFAVGEAVTPEFRFVECENLYILPPAAFFDHECDANPTLKSVVSAQFAMDDVLRKLADSTTAKNTRRSSADEMITLEIIPAACLASAGENGHSRAYVP